MTVINAEGEYSLTCTQSRLPINTTRLNTPTVCRPGQDTVTELAYYAAKQHAKKKHRK